jgi:hypothetical protein
MAVYAVPSKKDSFAAAGATTKERCDSFPHAQNAHVT